MVRWDRAATLSRERGKTAQKIVTKIKQGNQAKK